MVAAMLSPWNLGGFTPHIANIFSKISNYTDEDPKSRAWTLRRYPSLRSPDSVLPKPLEMFADAEKYTSFRGIKETMTILATFGFLKTVESSTSLVDRLPIFGNVSLIMKRVTASCVPYLAEESKEDTLGVAGKKQITVREFDKIFPILMDDLVEHAGQYGVPKDTLDWYRNVGSFFQFGMSLD